MLNGFPFQAAASDESTCSTSHRDVEGVSQTLHICLKDSVEGIHAAHLLEDIFDFGGSAVDEDGRVDADVIALELINEAVLEKSLGNCDEDGATEGLEELDTGSADRNPFLRENSLNDQDTNLETSTDTETSNNLISKPLPERRVNIEGGEHAGADSVENHAGNDDGTVVTDGSNDTTGDNGAENGGEE